MPRRGRVFTKLLLNKYYVDEIYDALFVNRIKDLSIALGLVDAKIIDGIGVDGAGWLSRFFSERFDVVGQMDHRRAGQLDR